MPRKPVEINPECGKRVKEWLVHVDIKQEELAKRINWTQQHISRVINGKERLTEDRAKDIAEKIPDGNGEHILADYLLCKIEARTDKELIRNRFTTLNTRTDLISDLIESLGYSLTYKDILSRDAEGEFYIPMIEIKNKSGVCRYMRQEEYGAFTKKIIDVVAGLLLLEMDFIRRGGENG